MKSLFKEKEKGMEREEREISRTASENSKKRYVPKKVDYLEEN